MRFAPPLTLAFATLVALPAYADGELNLYSSRHYDTDERLYSDFTEATGITINRIEGNADRRTADGRHLAFEAGQGCGRVAIRGQRCSGKPHSGLSARCRQRMVWLLAACADHLL